MDYEWYLAHRALKITHCIAFGLLITVLEVAVWLGEVTFHLTKCAVEYLNILIPIAFQEWLSYFLWQHFFILPKLLFVFIKFVVELGKTVIVD